MSESKKVRFTTILNKYPTFRDDVVNGCWKWLAGRRADDNAEGLWRVHDKLYDLNEFVDHHPGGSEWLTLTEGTDVTEAFESYHIFNKASQVLSMYFVRDASKPRNYKFTYDENGFYRTLKDRVAKKLKVVNENELWKSKWYLDLVVASLVLTAITAVRVDDYLVKILLILVSGQCMAWINGMSHNFIHQPNNLRMYAANITLVGWRDWRVFHGLSHHLYPNSHADFEASAYEPFLNWIPTKGKSRFSILFSYFATPFSYAFLFHAALIMRITGFVYSRRQKFHLDEFVPLLLPLLMLLFDARPITFLNILITFVIWNVIVLTGSFLYSVVAVNAGHHGPTIVHEGDEFKSLDYGIYQLSATIERGESNSNLFMSLTHFGDHMLHHMFPSLDHSVLPHLRETLIETCREFEGEFRKYSMLDAVVGQFQQLGRTESFKLK